MGEKGNAMALKSNLPATAFGVIACLTATGFGLAVPRVQAGQDKGTLKDSSTPSTKRESGPEDSRAAAELVKKLGSDKFQERETAAKALRAIGAAAIPAIETGVKSESTEIAQRCERLLTAIRRDDVDRIIKALLSDTDFKAKFDYPIWLRWVNIVGDDRTSRELFAEVLAVDGAAAALKSLEDNPKSANKLYPTELFRLHASVEPRTRIGDRHIRSLSSCYSLGEAAYGMYLGTFSGATSVKPKGLGGPVEADPEIEVLEALAHLLYKKRGPWSAEAADAGKYQSDNRPLIGPRNKLLVASAANLMNPRAIERGLRSEDGLRNIAGDLSICLPLARTVCRQKAFPSNVRACSWPYLAEAGEVEFLADIAEFKTDSTLVQQFWRSDENNREYRVLVSDVSIATQLLMHKQVLKDFGFFEKLNEEKRRVDRSCFAFGFPSDASRKAAHEKALAFLAKAPVPKGPPAASK
jgi:hypothetical protein